MILTYSQYRELNNNDDVDASSFVESVIESLNEHGSLSYDEMVSLFEEVAEFHGYEITDLDAYVQSLSSLLNSYISENIDENDQYSYTLNNDVVNEDFLKTAKGVKSLFAKKDPGFLGHASNIIGGVAKAHGKAAAAGHKAAVKKQQNLMKHDYKMAKLSGKTAAGGFDNYAKLSSTANNRY